MTMQRILVTGAGGFVGSALATGFARLGWQVCALDRAFDPSTRTRLAGLELVTADLSAGPVPALARADVVIHAAALTTDPATLGISMADHVGHNIRPLLAALDHAAATLPRAFVFLSSTGVFAAADGHPDLTDDSLPTATGPYSAAKRAGEFLVPAALPSQTACHILRLGHICGLAETTRPTRQRVSVLAAMVAAARAGQPVPLAETNPLRDWTMAEDLAPALARLLQGPGQTRPVHFGSPHRMSDREIAARIATHIPGMQLALHPAPAPKGPMRPSALPALEGFAWTSPEALIDTLCAREVVA
ncbi:hypothetical protein MASR2M74_02420 [Paracoccaceae bacterium]